MTRLIRAEWLKLRTVRAPWLVLAALFALSLAIAPAAVADVDPDGARAARDLHEILAIGPGLLTSLTLLLLGALAAAGEFQHGTVVRTYLGSPRRERVLAARLALFAALGAAVAAIGTAATYAIVLPLADAAGLPAVGVGDLATLAVALVLSGALAGAAGVAIGSILRQQTAAMVAILLWTLAFERFVGGFLGPVLPFGALLSAVGLAGDDAPAIAVSLALLAGWTAALAGLARWRFVDLDVA